MNTAQLITMANQIGAFFESYPDALEAGGEIATHLQKFWAPRMRSAPLAHLGQHQGKGLKPIVLASIRRHRARREPAPPAASL